MRNAREIKVPETHRYAGSVKTLGELKPGHLAQLPDDPPDQVREVVQVQQWTTPSGKEQRVMVTWDDERHRTALVDTRIEGRFWFPNQMTSIQVTCPQCGSWVFSAYGTVDCVTTQYILKARNAWGQDERCHGCGVHWATLSDYPVQARHAWGVVVTEVGCDYEPLREPVYLSHDGNPDASFSDAFERLCRLYAQHKGISDRDYQVQWIASCPGGATGFVLAIHRGEASTWKRYHVAEKTTIERRETP